LGASKLQTRVYQHVGRRRPNCDSLSIWLITPVLKYLSINQWRLIAFVVAAASGWVFFRLKLPVLALACGSMAGLLA